MKEDPIKNLCGSFNNHYRKPFIYFYKILHMKSEHISILQKLGLTAIEAKTYLTLSGIGKALAGEIAERAHIHRRNTYDALEKLLQKGLVSYTITNNKKYWNAVHPEKIVALIRENENLLSSIMTELTSNYETKKTKQRVEVFEGLGGMKTFFDDMANTKQDIIMLFATGKAYSKIPNYMKIWEKKINNDHVKVRVLINHGINKGLYKNYKYGEIRTLPKDFITPTQIFIYGNKSAIAIWSEEPLSILITSNEITEGFLKYSDFLWKICK